MYKNIILSILVILISGCSEPKPDQAPSWYTTLPRDSELFYAVGSYKTLEDAKHGVINSMRTALTLQLNSLFKSENHQLKDIDKTTLDKIFVQNSDISNKLSLSNLKIVKTENFNGNVLVLISTPREDIFNKIKLISDVKYNTTKQESQRYIGNDKVKRFLTLDRVIESFPLLASLTGYKKLLIPAYDSDDEFKFLKEMKSEYDGLKNSINFYILSDINSRIFSSVIRKSLHLKGISTDNSSNSKNALRLLLTSKTDESQDYSFNRSKSLLKLTLFDSSKNKISFKQHTFIGQSRKSYQDAKIQAAINLKHKIKRFGIFHVIGIEQ